jgi:methionine synthase I (cobalamin-dependent)
MLFLGETTADALDAAFSEQAHALAEAGVDAILVETMTDLDEAAIAVQAAARTGLPVIASMVFDSGPDRDRTMMGVSIADAAERLAGAGACVLGANCGIGIEGAASLVAQFRAASSLPVWIKPNAGLPELEHNRIVYRISPGDYARHAPVLVAAGATFIGGCCGTTPDFIRALRAILDARHAP